MENFLKTVGKPKDSPNCDSPYSNKSTSDLFLSVPFDAASPIAWMPPPPTLNAATCMEVKRSLLSVLAAPRQFFRTRMMMAPPFWIQKEGSARSVRRGRSPWPWRMESDDGFNQFVMNELIGPCSSNDENDLFFLVRRTWSLRIWLIIRVELVPLRDMTYWIEKDCFITVLCTKIISQIILCSERRHLDAGSHVCNYLFIFLCDLYYSLTNICNCVAT